jgi:restriction endonuclease S subunit
MFAHIAEIQMGYSFREGLEFSSRGNLSVIQMKDLTDDNRVDCRGLSRVNLDKIPEQHFVRKGDLVFRSRGLYASTAILDESPGDAVIAAPLYRIRIAKPEKVIPEYVNWYFTRSESLRYFQKNAEGTHSKKLNKQVLENMTIKLPDLKTQRKIVELFSMYGKEKELLTVLIKKREKLISKILDDSLSDTA